MTTNSIKDNLYKYAKDFIVHELKVDELTLLAYLNPKYEKGSLSLNEIYEHFLLHAKNKGNGGGAIENRFGTPDKKSERWASFKAFLKDFNPYFVLQEFPTIFELFPHLKESFKPLTGDETEPNMFVYLYLLTILDTAHFFNKNNIKTGNDFYLWVDKKIKANPESIFAEIESISGIGPALSRDLIKELGFTDYVKPDVHTIAVAYKLNLVQSPKYPIKVAKELKDVANACGVTAYALDKLLWLIGSGNYGENVRHDEKQRLLATDAYMKYRRKSKIEKFIEYVHNK